MMRHDAWHVRNEMSVVSLGLGGLRARSGTKGGMSHNMLSLSVLRCLGIEVRIGESIGPDALEEPPEWGGIGHTGGLGLTSTAREHTTNMAMDVGNY